MTVTHFLRVQWVGRRVAEMVLRFAAFVPLLPGALRLRIATWALKHVRIEVWNESGERVETVTAYEAGARAATASDVGD